MEIRYESVIWRRAIHGNKISAIFDLVRIFVFVYKGYIRYFNKIEFADVIYVNVIRNYSISVGTNNEINHFQQPQ
ncbi:hypothetical protein DERF_001536 [Dermatophagoides farinae]|uniref:Uncharacterized protein n=1 Tax=Dermatophagoides farinae TaxID=6954 RepID=A0A922IC12_DERFA|nr:hypothetical protein DERF_001536 [Dermatophagoides farinae]